MQKELTKSLILLSISLVLLATTVFAWFAISSSNKIDEFALNSTSYKMELSLEVKLNNGTYTLISTKKQMDELFSNAIPSDVFSFKLNINYLGSDDLNVDILLYNIADSELLEWFYIKDFVSVYSINQLLTEIDLKDKTLNELRDSNKNVILLNNLTLEVNSIKTIEFSLVFNENSEVQNKILEINALRVAGK